MRTHAKTNRMCIPFASHTAALLDAGRVRSGFTAYMARVRRMENQGRFARSRGCGISGADRPTSNLAPRFVLRRL